MNRSLLRLVIGGALLIGVLGSGPCPGCVDDECSRPDESWCADGVAYFCAEPNENGAYALLAEDCVAEGLTCVVVEAEGEGEIDRATCAAECPDGAACVDAGCAGDACLSTADAATD